MKKLGFNIKLFLGVYFSLVASIWGIAEAYTYFTDDALRMLLGSYWWTILYGVPYYRFANFDVQPFASYLISRSISRPKNR